MSAVLCRVPFQIWINRTRNGGRKRRIFSLIFAAGIVLFAMTVARGAYLSVVTAANGGESIPTGIELGSLVFFTMLCFSNFVCSLAIFYSAKDIPFLLALPVSMREFLFARGSVCAWNASWSTLLFGAPMFAGILAAGHPTVLGAVSVVVTLAGVLFITAAIGISISTLFVNIVPMSRFVEFFAVLITVFVLCLTALAPELGPNLPQSHARLHEANTALLKDGLAILAIFPPSLFSQSMLAALHGEIAWRAIASMFSWCLLFGLAADRIFNAFFLRGWDSTFGSDKRDRHFRASSGGTSILGQQTRAFVRKERRMFLRDPAQAVQLLVILLLTFLYLFNLTNLRSLSFAVEEGTRWWQGVLGVANISLGGCIASAIATRFVFTSVSIEGRAYPLIRATPISLTKFLMGKCIAWFWPICAVTTTLLLSGGCALQLSELSLAYTFIISIALTLGLVGLGVGMGAVYARFDWDHSSSLQSSFGSLLFMLLSFVLILATLLPSGFLFFTASIPNFGEDLGPVARFLPQTVAILVVIAMNLIVAKGAVSAGRERLLEMERA